LSVTVMPFKVWHIVKAGDYQGAKFEAGYNQSGPNTGGDRT